MITLVYADTGDWVGVYRDGQLLREGHSFDEDELLGILGIEHEAIHEANVEATGWRLPKALTEVAR